MIGTIGGMGFKKHIGLPFLEDFCKCLSIPGLANDKIAIQINIPGIPPKTAFIGAILMRKVKSTTYESLSVLGCS